MGSKQRLRDYVIDCLRLQLLYCICSFLLGLSIELKKHASKKRTVLNEHGLSQEFTKHGDFKEEAQKAFYALFLGVTLGGISTQERHRNMSIAVSV